MSRCVASFWVYGLHTIGLLHTSYLYSLGEIVALMQRGELILVPCAII